MPRRLLLAILSLAPALAAAATPCAGTRFLADGAPLVVGGATTPAAIALDADGVVLGPCGAARPRVRARGARTVLRARWRRCGSQRRVALVARLDAGCSAIDGTLRVRGQGPQRFHATPSRCGDTRLDSVEACDGTAAEGDALCPAACRPAGAADACTCDPLLVQTTAGVVRGEALPGVRRFLGIPYAAPPVGARRWRPPAPPAAWSDVRDATRGGAMCPQTIPILNAASGDEDCLFANVVTPDPPPAAPAPVMVWIHGGGFTSGDGRQYTGSTDGVEIARRTGTVVVTLNYRLGVLGFLAHPALTAEDPAYPSSGNYGIDDQLAALHWVHDNVARFGGDPARVTIFGESAGGSSVCTLLVAPAAAGLFQRAIVQSGVCGIPPPTQQAAHEQGVRIATTLGCTGAADVPGCLRARPAADVLAALPPDPNFAFTEGTWGRYTPIVDGHLLPKAPLAAIAAGEFARVPLLVGSNGDEGTLFALLSHDNRGAPLAAADYPARLAYFLMLPALVDATIARYPLAAYPSPTYALAAAFGDGFIACPSIAPARRAAPFTSTWLYQFEYTGASFPTPIVGELGAFHSAEIQFVFGVPAGRPFTPEEETLSAALMGYWTRFAASGDPNGGGAPAWPAFTADERHLVADTTLAVADHPKRDECMFWSFIAY